MRRRLLSAGGSISLSSLPQGTLIGIEEDGVITPFLLAKTDYPQAGVRILLRKWIHSNRRWHTAAINAYASSAIDAWLNGEYYALLSGAVQNKIPSVNIRYTPGNGNDAVTTLSRKVFLLSCTETGADPVGNMNVEGADAGLFADANARKAYFENSTTEVLWWTRSPRTSYDDYTFRINTAGNPNVRTPTEINGIRPAFALPSSTKIDPIPTAQGYYLLIGG